MMKKENKSEFAIAEADKRTKILYILLPLLMLVIESDFFEEPITDAVVLISVLVCLAFFLLSELKVNATIDGIRIRIWKVPIWHIKLRHINRIEFVRSVTGVDDDVLNIIFECYGCPQYSDGKVILLKKYLELHMLRTYCCEIEKDKEKFVMQQLKAMFPNIPILDMSDKPPVS